MNTEDLLPPTHQVKSQKHEGGHNRFRMGQDVIKSKDDTPDVTRELHPEFAVGTIGAGLSLSVRANAVRNLIVHGD